MAFNPLEMVRENSKVVMAGITMVAMFVFVLTFGQGDILNTLTGGSSAGHPNQYRRTRPEH